MIRHRLIALYEMITGVFGVILIISSVASKGTDWNKAIVLLGIVIYAFIAYSGYALMYQPVRGAKLSAIAQAVQAIKLSFEGFTWVSTASAYVFIGYSEKGINLLMDVKVIDFYVGNIGKQEINIYLVPLILIILLLWKKKI